MRQRIISAFPGPGVPLDTAGDGYGWVSQASDVKPGKLVSAAVLVPLMEHGDGMTVLLTQRTAHLPSHAGQIAFPGGRVQVGDNTPERTALRETHEEVGVAPDQVELVGRLNVRVTGTGYRVTPVVGLIRPPVEVTPDPGEVADIFEVPLDFIMDKRNHKLETRIDKGVERQFYALPYGDYYIWGLTARLLISLSERLGETS